MLYLISKHMCVDDHVHMMMNNDHVSFNVISNHFTYKFFGIALKLKRKRGTELLPGLIFTKINFFIFRDMVKSLEHDVSTIIISNFD